MICNMITCPTCGAEMRQTRRGATFYKNGPLYICPVDEAETVKDEAGRLHRIEGATHTPPRRTWSLDELDWPNLAEL